MLAGVAGGLGDYFNIDPAIFRLAFVALAPFGGSGIILYVLGALFIPERDTGASIGEGLVRRAGGGRSAIGIGILVIAALILVENITSAGGLIWAAVLIGVGYLLLRNDGDDDDPSRPDDLVGPPDGDRRTAPPPRPSSTSGTGTSTSGTAPSAGGVGTSAGGTGTSTGAAGEGATDDRAATARATGGPVPGPSTASPRTTTTSSVPDLPPPPPGLLEDDDGWRPTPLSSPPEPPPPPSFLGRLTIAVALVLVGAVALVDNLVGLDLGVAEYFALGLTVVGVGLVVGARWGRARGLIGLGVILTLVVLAASTIPTLPVNGIGERTATPETVAELNDTYELGIGSLQLDLSELELDPNQRVPVDAEVGMGELIVTLPPDVGFDVDARSGLGEVVVLDRSTEGGDIDVARSEPGPEGSPTLELDLSTGLGLVEVQRAPEVR